MGDKSWTCTVFKPFRPKRNLSTNSSTPIYSFMPKIRLELTTKAASMLCSTNWASQAVYGDTRSWTWESDVQSQCFTKLDYIPYIYIHITISCRKFFNIRGTTWTFTVTNQQNLSLHCLPFQHSDIINI